jgi:hypothetical protein
VLDFEPRTISDDELATLTDLAAMVMRELELRREARNVVALAIGPETEPEAEPEPELESAPAT